MTAVRLSEEQFRATLDGLLEGVQILDRDLRYVYVNPTAAAQGRQTVDNVVGRLMREVFPGVEASEFYQTLERTVAGAPACRLNTPFDFPDGTVGHFQLMIEPVAEGGVFILSIETTAQVRAEAALAASEARHRALLEGLPDLVFLLDHEGVVLDFHTPPSVKLPHSRDAMVGRPFAALLPAAIAETATGVLQRVLATRLPGTLDYTLQLGGAARRFEATIVVSEDQRLTVVAHDVTARVSLEEQLRQAQKMEAIGQLTGGIAHDFNNVLTVISGNAELLAESAQEVGAPVPQEIADIMSASRHGAEMVAQLLQFSRRGVLRRQLVDPATVLTRVTTMLRRLLPESVQIDLVEPRTGHTLSLDTGALEQILTNLCTNARDAMPDGGTIRITGEVESLADRPRDAEPWVEPGEYYRITVRDGGAGMSEDTRRRLFEPFFTTKPFGSGTGLGMSMVYGLMKSHRGAIDVQSAPGEGTTVSLYFPLVPGPSAGELAVVSEEALAIAGGDEAILVVEDDPAIRSATRRALETKGYRVWEAADGALGLDTFVAHEAEIALIITDLVMPNLGGRQMAEAIRAHGSTVPILFTSGYSSDWIFGEAGVPADVQFMPKPWKLVDLFTRVRQALDGAAF